MPESFSDPQWAEFEELNAKSIVRPRDDFVFRFGQDFESGLRSKIGEIVYNPSDGLIYRSIKETKDVAPDYTNATSNLYWTWIAGSIGGFVSGRGWWTRYADGTLIQHGNRTNVENSTVENKVRAIVFPIEFFDDDNPVDINFTVKNDSYSTRIYNQVVANDTYVGCDLVFYLVDSVSRTFTRSWIAIGRWKA